MEHIGRSSFFHKIFNAAYATERQCESATKGCRYDKTLHIKTALQMRQNEFCRICSVMSHLQRVGRDSDSARCLRDVLYQATSIPISGRCLLVTEGMITIFIIMPQASSYDISPGHHILVTGQPVFSLNYY